MFLKQKKPEMDDFEEEKKRKNVNILRKCGKIFKFLTVTLAIMSQNIFTYSFRNIHYYCTSKTNVSFQKTSISLFSIIYSPKISFLDIFLGVFLTFLFFRLVRNTCTRLKQVFKMFVLQIQLIS